MTPDLSKPSTHFRGAITRSKTNRVERDGGQFEAGLIKGAAIVTRGEAKGHGLWLDSEFVDSVTASINARPAGIKSRFTHPSLSDDGLGRFLGRIDNATRDGDVVRADLHFSETAHDTPDGNLAKYVMDLAEQHPDSFGMSIVFMRDGKAEEGFREKNGERSPDADNRKNLRHARLAELFGADVVDEPAANPSGLFHRPHLARDAEALMSFAVGLTDEAPALVTLDVDPGRVAGFVNKFMADHGLAIVNKEIVMAKESEKLETKPATQPEPAKPEQEKPAVTDPPKPTQAAAAPSEAETELGRLASLKAAFPKDPAFVLEQFEAGHSAAEAQWEYLRRENEQLKGELAALKAGGQKPAAGSAPAAPFNAPAASQGGSTSEIFINLARERAEAKKIPLYKAMSELARERPDLPTH